VIKDLQNILQNGHGIPVSQYAVNHTVKSVHDWLARMWKMDYVVTCRFHGVIFAHLLNKPILAVAHHPKVTELMAELELSDYCVDIRDFDVSWLTERLSLMVNNAEETKSRTAASLMKNRKQLRNQFHEFIFGLKRSKKERSRSRSKSINSRY
jgi:polysaccharide pyruvyl transferase WcaK-like protein